MPSRNTNARIAALATTLVAGVLAVYALRPSTSGTGSAAHVQQQAAEVRTQVIRRTVHIVRHERPPRGRGTPARGLPGSTATIGAAASPMPRTGTSGSHPAVAGVAGVATGVSAPRTRTSGASARPTPPTSSAGAPVRTRSSGTSAAGAPSKSSPGAPVRTRTSGASTGGGSGASGAVRTRTSGGSGGDGGDHGAGHDD
jgi:hypothetical protein